MKPLKFVRTDLTVFDFEPKALRGRDFYPGILAFREEILPRNRSRIRPRAAYHCALCGGVEGSLLVEWKEGYEIIECPACGVATANFEVGDEQEHIDIAYNNDIYYQKFLREVVAQYDYRKNMQGRERYRYIVERLGLNPATIKVLDVGCGSGWFLSYLVDRGVECKGLEVNPMAVRFCQGRGLNAHATRLEDEPDGTYDVIGLFDVLEHITNAVDLASVARRKLRPGGYLVAYTPNIYSVSWELMGAGQNTLLPFEHTAFFAEKSFHYLASRSGLEVESVATFGFDIMDYFLMKTHEDGVDYASSLRDMMLLVQACLDKMNVANHFRVTFRRPLSE